MTGPKPKQIIRIPGQQQATETRSQQNLRMPKEETQGPFFKTLQIVSFECINAILRKKFHQMNQTHRLATKLKNDPKTNVKSIAFTIIPTFLLPVLTDLKENIFHIKKYILIIKKTLLIESLCVTRKKLRS